MRGRRSGKPLLSAGRGQRPRAGCAVQSANAADSAGLAGADHRDLGWVGRVAVASHIFASIAISFEVWLRLRERRRGSRAAFSKRMLRSL